MKWHKFDQSKGYRQLRPPIGKWVLLKVSPPQPRVVDLGVNLKEGLGLVANLPYGFALGYRKNAAGCKDSPYFVIPQFGGEVVEWCDCLPKGLKIPWGFPNETR